MNVCLACCGIGLTDHPPGWAVDRHLKGDPVAHRPNWSYFDLDQERSIWEMH
jgi:hypothetical protein